MSAIFLILMVSGSFLLGVSDVGQRKYLQEKIDPQVLLVITWLVAGLIGVFSLMFVHIPHIERGFWPAVIGTIVLNVISQNLFIRAFQLEEVSVISPLRLVTPLLVVGTGFLFLHEQPSLLSIFGIFITMVGLGVLLFFGQSSKRVWKFWSPGVLLGLCGAVLFAFSFPLDKIAVTHSSAFFDLAVTFIGVALMTFILNILFSPTFTNKLCRSLRTQIKPLLFLSVLLALGNILTLQALNYSLVAYAANLKRLSSFWAVILGGSFLREDRIIVRLIAVCIMFSGILISVILK